MGLLDTLKAKLAPAKDKAAGLAKEHGGKIEQGLDKAAKVVDEKTKGKYSDKIQSGTGKAKDALDRLADGSESGAAGGPGTSASPGSGTSAQSPGTRPTAGGTPTPPAS
ncbi:antitoxin [Streptomyces sp. TRM66268-LWL]|uniref:Antitoxin n=1 Tax=Streptomyces polyasparticus TaxID=2767826 RepID=A0ABR7SS40_9ACTN|nr:antitoxin [Streptomyces polyasparticus]MBC9718321.1 antitoxin [Streptomyces polyasparticus]